MILGLTGMLGAGKGTIAEHLTKNKHFVYLSVRNFLAADVLRHGKMVSRETIALAANRLKAANGEDYIIKELMTQARLEKRRSVIIESVRTPIEAQYLKAHGAKLWAIETDAKLRYARMMEGKKDTDKESFEQFVADSQKELATTNNSESILAEAAKLADVTIANNSTKEELYAQVDAAIAENT